MSALRFYLKSLSIFYSNEWSFKRNIKWFTMAHGVCGLYCLVKENQEEINNMLDE